MGYFFFFLLMMEYIMDKCVNDNINFDGIFFFLLILVNFYVW